VVDVFLVNSEWVDLVISGTESPRSYRLSNGLQAMKEDCNFYGMKTRRLHVEPILASPERFCGISS